MCNLKIIVNTSYLRDDIERYLSLKPKRPRRAVRACLQCQARKIKCTSGSPCEFCKARKVDCVYNEKSPKQYAVADTANSPRPVLKGARVAKPPLDKTSAPSPVVRSHPSFRYLCPTAVALAGKPVALGSGSPGGSSSDVQSKVPVARPASSPIEAADPGPEAVPANWPESMHHDTPAPTLSPVPGLDSSDLPELPKHSFVARFYTLMGSYLPYRDRETFEHRLNRGPLSMSLLYAMAALVSRVDAVNGHNNRGDGHRGGSGGGGAGGTKAALYTKTSKALVFPYISTPSLDVLYTLVLIAYNEFAEARDSALWTWSGMAIRMCYDLGLNNPQTTKADDQELYKHVFGSVVCLDRIVSLSTGRKTTIPDQDLAALAWLDGGNHKLLPSPPPSIEIHDPFRHLCQLMIIAGRLSNFINSGEQQDRFTHDPTAMADYLNLLTAFHTQLPMELYFDVRNFQEARKRKQSQTFLTIHVWHQALLIIVHCPPWNRNYSHDDAPSAAPNQPGLSQSQCDTASRCFSNIGDMISLADLIDPSSYLASPCVAQPLYLVACTAVNLSKFQPNTPYLEYSIRKAYGTCRSALTRMQTIWLGISSHLKSLDVLHSTSSIGSDDNVAAQASNSPHRAHVDDLAPDSALLATMSTCGGPGMVTAAEYDMTAASIISPFSLSSSSSADYNYINGMLPWGEVLECASTEVNEWEPEMLPWEMIDWATAANVGIGNKKHTS
ncbi:hypothetical protein N7486_010660 [Penicillium sp. IBT 16267x]|nr:hypothetical protein N7486_010660 [Penicillium sp. IBT 16267x]